MVDVIDIKIGLVVAKVGDSSLQTCDPDESQVHSQENNKNLTIGYDKVQKEDNFTASNKEKDILNRHDSPNCSVRNEDVIINQ